MIDLVLSSNKTDFTTSLDPPIELNPDKQYEVAFVSLQTSNTVPNITEINNKFSYSTDKGATWKTITFDKGAYELGGINAYIQKEMTKNGDFNKDTAEFYINIDFFIPTFQSTIDISHDSYMVDFGVTNSIASILGFNKEKIAFGFHSSPNIVKIEPVNSILLHCDISTGSYVNGSKSNVIYNFTLRVGPGYKVIQERINPIFHPVVRSPKIESIRMWLTDQDNKLIDMMGEEITINILIREKASIENLLPEIRDLLKNKLISL